MEEKKPEVGEGPAFGLGFFIGAALMFLTIMFLAWLNTPAKEKPKKLCSIKVFLHADNDDSFASGDVQLWENGLERPQTTYKDKYGGFYEFFVEEHKHVTIVTRKEGYQPDTTGVWSSEDSGPVDVLLRHKY